MHLPRLQRARDALLDMIHLAAQGMCVLSMDCRGQNGQSQDFVGVPRRPRAGVDDQGHSRSEEILLSLRLRRCGRGALELLAKRDEVDARVWRSPAAARAAGSRWRWRRCPSGRFWRCPDIPFLCDFRRAIAITPAGPYPEIPVFLKAFPHLYEQAIRTLSYFDCMNLAPWIKCRTVISNCLWDDICPPSTIFAAYNHMTAPKADRDLSVPQARSAVRALGEAVQDDDGDVCDREGINEPPVQASETSRVIETTTSQAAPTMIALLRLIQARTDHVDGLF